MGSNKDQGEVGTGNSPRRVSGKRKRGRSASKHKKVERSNKNKHPNNKRRYKITSSSSSTEKFSSPKRHKSQRKKRNYHNCSSWPYSSLESSVTRSREGSLGRRFQVISEEDKFRYNLPTNRAKDANAHFESYVKEADLKQQILTENLVPDNLDQLKKLDHFVFDILKDIITYIRRYNILAALNCPAQQSKEMLREEAYLLQRHDRNLSEKSLANTWWLQLNKKTEHSNICLKGKEKTKDLSKWPFRSTEKGFWRATIKILPRQKKWEVETKNILQKLLPSSWEKQWIPR